jgi:hypothetical protein
MLVDEVDGSQFRQPAMSPPENGIEPARPESRALVALDPLLRYTGQSATYRYAPFVAQLVATKDQHPQTRERRRADPHDALAAYRAAAALTT